MESFFDTKHLYRSYFKMALPVVLGLAVTLVYNLADTFFIAQTNDTNLIAGVSLCAPAFTTLMAFGNIYGQGGSSLISRMLGQNNLEGTARISSFSFYIAIATGAVLAVVMTLFRAPLLTVLFQATGKIVPAFLLSISRQGVVFIVVLVVCVRLFTYNGVIMAQAVADVLSAVLALGLLFGYNPLKQ